MMPLLCWCNFLKYETDFTGKVSLKSENKIRCFCHLFYLHTFPSALVFVIRFLFSNLLSYPVSQMTKTLSFLLSSICAS